MLGECFRKAREMKLKLPGNETKMPRVSEQNVRHLYFKREAFQKQMPGFLEKYSISSSFSLLLRPLLREETLERVS